MTEIPAKVWYDPNTGRLQVTLTDYAGRRPQIKHVTVRAEWRGGSHCETAISVPRLDGRERIRGAGLRESGTHHDAPATPDGAALAQANEDLRVLAAVGDLYLRALDDDPANEYLSLGAAIRVTQIRQAVERQGYEVRWEPGEEPGDGS